MDNFKNSILIVLFNYSNCIKNKDIILKIYQKHFKTIIFYSDYPIIDDEEVNFIHTNKGIRGHIIFKDFYIKYKELLYDCDGLFYTMDDNIINVNILNFYNTNKIIYYKKDLLLIDEYIDIPLENIDNGKYGKKAINKLFEDNKFKKYNINRITAGFSDFFYLPKKYLTEELFDLFELFAKYEVYLEVSIPTIINNIEKDENNYQKFEDMILWFNDRKKLLDYNFIYSSLNHLHCFALHPIKFNENPISKEWLENIFCKNKCIIITTFISPSNFFINLFDYKNNDIIIVNNNDVLYKRIDCIYLNLNTHKNIFPEFKEKTYYSRKKLGYLYAKNKGYNDIILISDDVIFTIIILSIILIIIINFSIYDRI
jgi:hypothetical protein